ncbi:cysteine protease 2, putative [Babesia bigemina]|uniref:Cysteine protease 2 n=1 Tax=Babesia bigemina TaxID=5866 RepID=C0A1J0_BABBI|nr:cysteine protease 2, putative [Babesia bigemina]BAH30175.1 cysteine protease 2 [Babesia bigemina]CDR97544.1 cysteine protease 2, putative [Babesia bigemina]|eukprot:XP_012769730.1 cysteine protease 2, putative [Babesia bigemina]
MSGTRSYMSNDDHHYICSDEVDRDTALIGTARRRRTCTGNKIAICVLSLAAIGAITTGIVLLIVRSTKDPEPPKLMGPRKLVEQRKEMYEEPTQPHGGCLTSSDLLEELNAFYELGGIGTYNDEELCRFVHFKRLEKRYNRRYTDVAARHAGFLNFRRNMAIVEEHKKKANATYTKGPNHFFDMDVKELASKLLHPIDVGQNFQEYGSLGEVIVTKDNQETYSLLKGHTDDPYAVDVGSKVSFENVNWRTPGAVSPVKDQGHCGSCWAFAAIGAVESLFRMEKQQYLTFSEQELVSCDLQSNGCGGGFSDFALEYIKKNGVTSSEDWNYEAINGECSAHHGIRYYIKDYVSARGANVASTLLVRAPTVVYVAFTEDLFHYSGGVYNGECPEEQLNHAVLLVGEGYDATVKKRYWLIKNSWGSDWGEDGFIRLERTDKGYDKCGVLSFGFIPTGAVLAH